jgi:hypothetical protein
MYPHMDDIIEYIISTLTFTISKKLNLDLSQVEQVICETFYDKDTIPAIEPETEIFKPTSSWILKGTNYVVKGRDIIDVIGKINGDQFVDLESSDIFILDNNFINYTIHRLNPSKKCNISYIKKDIEKNDEKDDENNDDQGEDSETEAEKVNEHIQEEESENEEKDYPEHDSDEEKEKPININKKKLSKTIEITCNKNIVTFEIKDYNNMKKWIEKQKINYKFIKDQYNNLVKAKNNNMPCFKPNKKISFVFD